MILYSFQELLLLTAAAIAIDWIVGDPRRPVHPVILIGRLIAGLEKKLAPERRKDRPGTVRLLGVALTAVVLAVSFLGMWAVVWAADAVHRWAGYAVSAWFISTTIAVKGLKEAAMQVYEPLSQGRLEKARKYAGYIVSRDTSRIDEGEAARAVVETVSENTVDAFMSPVIFALIGGAPLAMLYRAANTLDSMVGYKNDKYIRFGWCSARIDDALNYIPARLTGLLMVLAAALLPGMRAARAAKAIAVFASKHPSPNGGIPESAAAGALGIELGGRNVYFGEVHERARMGWPLRPLDKEDIRRTVRLLYTVSIIVFAGVTAAWLALA